MKTNTHNQFKASMILGNYSEIINEDSLKYIHSCFINEFAEKENFLAENKTETDLGKRKPLRIGFAIASGSYRAKKAIELALLPLLFDKEIVENSNSVLLQISSHIIEINIDEVGLINDYIQEKLRYNANITITNNEDKNLDEALAITIVISEK